jgi:thymidylate synthase (FAD)
MIDVTYINHMGDDLSTVNAARVSFGKKSDYMPRVHNGEPKVLQFKDDRLIKYLAEHEHISPFGHAFASFHVKAPVFVARQLVKHKFLRWNEISRRYVDEEPEFFTPTIWRGRSADKKQGSEGEVKTNANVEHFYETALKVYKQMIDEGVAPEQARMVLPQAAMTEWIWSGSVDAFASMCALRCKPDTQRETQIVANNIDEIMGRLFPVSWTSIRMYEE